MRNILDICREYGEPPSWWDTLPDGDQVLLLGDYRVRVADHNRRIAESRRG